MPICVKVQLVEQSLGFMRGYFLTPNITLALRPGLSLLLGVLTGYYVGQIMATTSSLSGLANGPLYGFVESFITPIGVIVMGLGIADIVMSKSKKSKED